MHRYTLDLSELFSDHRAKIFVLRKKPWKHVQCLLDHVRNTFVIKPECYLTDRADVFYPETEDLDIIQEKDLVRVCISNSSGTQQKSAPKMSDESRGLSAQNGKRKHVSSENSSGSDDDSSSDSDDESETLPKIFVGLEKVSKDNGEDKVEMKPKRKRIRKRKSKKKVDDVPPKVVVKTYGKTKTPPIVISKGDATSHVRFGDSDKDEAVVPVIEEQYRNLNRTTTPRVVKAMVVEAVPTWNGEAPAIPEYDVGSGLEVDQVIDGGKTKTRRKVAKKSVQIKKETIEAAATWDNDQSLTWDTEITNHSKETFISNYTGEDFWESLRISVDNFPSISVPSVNDVIACNVGAETCLAFVEHVCDDAPSSKLTLRRLNVTPVRTELATLDQLTAIRLVATYQL